MLFYKLLSARLIVFKTNKKYFWKKVKVSRCARGRGKSDLEGSDGLTGLPGGTGPLL